MNSRLYKLASVPFVLFLLTALACSASSVPFGSVGSGTFNLPDPTAGLNSLSSYQVTLQRTFTGTNNSQPDQWQDSWTLLVSTSPAARLFTLDSSGPSSDQALSGLIGGEINGVAYNRPNASSPCTADLVAKSQQTVPLELAKFLPPLSSAKVQGSSQTVNGLSVQQYHFDGSSLKDKTISASGDVWIAVAQHVVVKYTLDEQGDESTFGTGVKGMMHWEYDLSQVDQPLDLTPPPGCPPGLVDAPLLTDAANVQKFPGMTSYTTKSSVADASAFYTKQLTGLNWQASTQPSVGTAYASQAFERSSQTLTVQISPAQGGGNQVLLILQLAGASSVGVGTTPGPTPGTTGGGNGNASSLVSASLNLLLGSGSKASVLSSYHLEVKGTTIKPQEQYTLSADIQGANVHFHYQSPTSGKIEGYIVGGKDYLVQNGAAQAASGQAQLAWLTWSLEPTFALATASLGASLSGEETVAGLAAGKYLIDTANASASALSSVQAFSNISGATGTVWVDKQSGALLQMTLDYTGTGNGKGHVEVAVSNVGNVTVSLP